MLSAEELLESLELYRFSPDATIEHKKRLKQLDNFALESRIAGLREAYSLSLNRVKVLDRIAELEKELKP